MAKSNRQPYQVSDQKFDPVTFKTISQNPPQQPRIAYEDYINNESPSSSTAKSTCTTSRIICIQLLILLLLLVLAAIIIPIVVIVLDSQASGSPCATTFSDSFTNNIAPTTTQCTAWRLFTTGLTCTTYSKMRMYGSNDPAGITVTNSAVVTALAIALRYNTTLSVIWGGLTWKVGPCGGAYEITATGYLCNCVAGYTVRGCHPNRDWGGINSATCNAPSQTMTLYFE